MSRSLDCEPSGIFQASCVPDPGGYCAWEEGQLVPGGRESTAASVLYFWELFCLPIYLFLGSSRHSGGPGEEKASLKLAG